MAGQSAQSRVFGPPEQRHGGDVPAGQFARALVVDDERDVRQLLDGMLGDWGIRPRAVGDVAGARRELADVPDLVIVDLGLPDGSGVTIAREAMALNPSPVVIGISGNASAPDVFELARLGVRAFLVKPFSSAQLGDALREGLVEHETYQLREGRTQGLSRATHAALMVGLDDYCAQYGLTPRQRQLVAKLLEGTPRSGLAEALGISENTCKTDVRRVLARCGLTRTADVPAAVFESLRAPRADSVVQLRAALAPRTDIR